MPSYDYVCDIHGEFEEFHSITIKLEFCPKCSEEGKQQPIKRLISLSGKGIVELYGQDFVDKVKADAKQIQKDASKSESLYANLIGEKHYQNLQTQMDRRSKR